MAWPGTLLSLLRGSSHPSLSEGDRSAALGCPSLASGPCSGKLMEAERTNLKVPVGSSVLQSLPPFLRSMHSAPSNL